MKSDGFEDSLNAIQNTIANYDNKAGVLLTAVGIVFGFSLFSIQELENKADTIKTLCCIFGALYLFAFVTSLIFFGFNCFPKGEK